MVRASEVAGSAAVVGLLIALATDWSVGGPSKFAGIATVGFLAMVAGALLVVQRRTQWPGDAATSLVWGYGLASGAMIASASLFLVPSAVDFHPRAAGVGVAAGLVTGFATHALGHLLEHAGRSFDHRVTALVGHAVTAGAIVGVVYEVLPSLDLLFGLAIVSHKGPAGYATGRHLRDDGPCMAWILVPAAVFGLAGYLGAVVGLPAEPWIAGAVFGFGAGIFLHLAMDFVPRCEVGGDVVQHVDLPDDAHARLDALRMNAVVSTTAGAVAVVAAWYLLH